MKQCQIQTLRWRGGGGWSSRPLDKGGPVTPQNFFFFFSVWCKNWGVASSGPPLDPLL